MNLGCEAQTVRPRTSLPVLRRQKLPCCDSQSTWKERARRRTHWEVLSTAKSSQTYPNPGTRNNSGSFDEQERQQWPSNHLMEPSKTPLVLHASLHPSERLDLNLLAVSSHPALAFPDRLLHHPGSPILLPTSDGTPKLNNRSKISTSNLVPDLSAAQRSRWSPQSRTTMPTWVLPSPHPRPRSKRPTAGWPSSIILTRRRPERTSTRQSSER